MKRVSIACFIALALIPVWSCRHTENIKVVKETENRILQQEDGTVSLKLDKAGRYCDQVNPSNNTADWDIVISKPGRFKVWLSSATKDTSNLKYGNPVKISLLDDQLEVKPLADRIVLNSDEVQYPYFRADSYVGSVYVSEPGEYNLQVISDKVIVRTPGAVSQADTELLSVLLTPTTH